MQLSSTAESGGASLSNRMRGESVTRENIVTAAYRRCPGLGQRAVKQLVDEVLEEIVTELARGENVKLSGFRSFILRDKRAREARNPRNGIAAVVTERRVVLFRPSHHLKARINGGRRNSVFKPSLAR